MEFGGCVLLVSHDRYFLDKLVNHTFAFEGDGVIKDFPGNYSDYREWKADEDEQKREEEKLAAANKQKTATIKETKTESTGPKTKLSFKEKHELETLEKEIAELESLKSMYEIQLTQTTEFEKLQEIGAKLKTTTESLETKGSRWLEIQESLN